jgi:hypothetical protein
MKLQAIEDHFDRNGGIPLFCTCFPMVCKQPYSVDFEGLKGTNVTERLKTLCTVLKIVKIRP